MPRLGVTRESTQLIGLIRKAVEKEIEIIPLPFITTRQLQFELPDECPVENIDWLLFTSANGVHSFFSGINKMGLHLSSRTKIGVVGFKTEAALLDYDVKADFIPSEAYGINLFNELTEKENLSGKNVLYARAEQVITDPSDTFETASANYYPLICYCTDTNRLPKTKIAGFTEEDHIFFTAPSAVNAYADQFNKPKAKTIAIGHTTAEAMKKHNWHVDIILDKPDVLNVLEYI